MRMILVTGGTGFIGRKIVHALRAEDRPVRCLVRDRRRAAELERFGAELVEGDVTDARSLRTAADGCEAVVHLVAIIAGRPQDFERTMSQATRDLLAASERAGIRRFVLMSALGTSQQTRFLVPYFGAKWDMEQAVKGSGLEHVIFRPSFVFGRDGGALPTFMRLARLPFTPVVGPGDQRIQPIWVDDVAAYFVKAIDLPQAGNRTFELGGPDVLTWTELYERIKKVLGKRGRNVHIPMTLMRANAAFLERLPGPTPVTRDQLKMLAAGDNTVSSQEAPETFGVAPIDLDEQLRRAA
jgi:uncharacterized protein YbjT (DUF2867 family)